MKPLNADTKGCSPISSNCVVWQGPDIACINLCKGDTISDVTFKLATELCSVLETLSISSYDLSCFNLTSCQPADFQDLLQFIMNRICSLETCTGCTPNCNNTTPAEPVNASGARTGNVAGCPDCVVSIAECFYYVDNATGDTVTSLQLVDYARLIGQRVCSLAVIIQQQQITLNNYGARITALENAPPPTLNLPTVNPSCVVPAIPGGNQMDQVLESLALQFCQLVSATGQPSVIVNEIAKQCAGLNTDARLSNPPSTMASIPGWSSSVNNMAQAVGNIWLTICDIRTAIKTIQTNCCPTGCDGISLSMVAVLSGSSLTVFIQGTVPAGFTNCLSGSNLVVKDTAGGMSTYPIDVMGILNVPAGYTVGLGANINTALDLNLNLEPCCLTNPSTNATCEICLSYYLVNNATCPDITFSTDQTTLSYSFTSATGNYTYNVQLWNADGSLNISNQVWPVSGPVYVAGTFTSLTPGTTYKVRVTVVPTACPECTPTECPFNIITTAPLDCLPTGVVSAVIQILP